MNWIDIKDEAALNLIKSKSADKAQVIFKHSTRCSISAMAKSRLERAASSDAVDFNYLDLIKHRNLSQKIADEYKVEHESPQILLIKNGECIYDESHTGIAMDEILQQAATA